MEIEEVGANPTRLAAAVHAQLRHRGGSVPVHAIAEALDIVAIREEPLTNFEAAMVTTLERSYGSILVNSNSNRQRRRYSVAHELLHFLNAWHEPTEHEGFSCSRGDMLERDTGSKDRHLRQEAEANLFAIELLAPRSLVQPYLDGEANLTRAMSMADALDISREAAARRYVALHEENLAVLFASDGRLRYYDCQRSFPPLSLRKADSIPDLPSPASVSNFSRIEEVDPDDWLRRPHGIGLSAQILRQQEGFATILLRASGGDDEDGQELEDTFERFSPGTYGRRD